jgi:hypothetical protein
MITIINVLTNERRHLPDSINANPLFLGPPYAPGSYDIRNGSTGDLTVVFDGMLHVTVPAGSRWNVSNNENLYSWKPVGVDYAAWTTGGLFRGIWGAGWAPTASV